MASKKLVRSAVAFGGAGALAALLSLGSPAVTRADSPPVGVDLSTYVRVGRFNLPEPTRTSAPPHNLLAQEASGVTYDWDTDTLFVVGDGGTAVVQVTKTGALVDSMTLATGGSPQGTEFYDTEGISYVGGGKFVFVEERDRQVVLFTYVAGTTLTRAAVKTVKLGTSVGNIGLEGISYDPQTSGFIAVKETTPQGIFQTGIDFAAGTATNGSPTTVNSTNLFDPSLTGLADFADVFALSNLPSLAGHPDSSHLLVLSQESARIVQIDRAGVVSSSLTIVSDPGNPLPVDLQQHEGLTMDRAGNLYLVSENGGGDFDHPQLWVYSPSSAVNQAPTGLSLANAVSAILENTSTVGRLKVADLVVADDGIGTNTFAVSGADAASFEADSTGLYIRAGTVLDYETKTSYAVTVSVDDTGVGASPDASTTYSLSVIDVVDETATSAHILITESSAWGSGNAPYAADWFEVTNTGATTQDITNWRVDDNSNSFGSGIVLNGVTSIAPGQSVVFIEIPVPAPASSIAATTDAFKSTWFGTHVPAGFQIGWYSGGGIGLSTGGDALNLFDAAGARITGYQFGTAPTTLTTYDNRAGVGGTTLPLPFVSTLSAVGVNGGFHAVNDVAEIGSPGRIANHAPAASAGLDQTLEAVSSSGAPVSLSGAGSFDVDGDFLTYEWSESGSPLASGIAATVTLPIGTHTLTLTVSDPYGASGTGTVHVTVQDTTPPAISGTPDGITVEATSSAGAVVTFTAPTAEDLVDGPVTVVVAHPSGSTFPLGTTLNACTATDAHGNHSSSSFRVTVRDTTPPTITVPADVTVEATSPTGQAVSIGTATASDLFGPVVITNDAPALFHLGTTTVHWTATDANGLSSGATQRVTVRDTTAPAISASGLPETIWPANHKLVRLTPTVTVSDAGDAAPSVTLAVTSSEADSGLGGDVVVHSPTDVEVRAERAGKGNGRVYTFTWTATDASHNSRTFTAVVAVPHDQGKDK